MQVFRMMLRVFAHEKYRCFKRLAGAHTGKPIRTFSDMHEILYPTVVSTKIPV